jgi:citrate synthase
MVGGTPGGETVGDRLADLVGLRDPALVPIVNTVLVLLADHELAASTFAARIAASVRADPYSVIASGLGPTAGALHGAASAPVVALFQEIAEPGRAGVVIGERLARHEHLPGIGHKVYRAHDPRAQILLKLLRETGHPRMEVVAEVAKVVTNRHPMVVNVDFALGALAWVGELDRAATQVMFAVARTAGWLAHAIEEYGEDPLRFRYRVAYSGFSPQNDARGLPL